MSIQDLSSRIEAAKNNLQKASTTISESRSSHDSKNEKGSLWDITRGWLGFGAAGAFIGAHRPDLLPRMEEGAREGAKDGSEIGSNIFGPLGGLVGAGIGGMTGGYGALAEQIDEEQSQR